MRDFGAYILEASASLDTRAVHTKFVKALSKFGTAEGSPGDIANAVRKLSKEYLFNVSIRKTPELDPGLISVWGFYDGSVDQTYVEDDGTDYPIELILIFSSKDKKLVLTPEGVIDFASYLTETLTHEWIHLRQERARKWLNTGPKSKYVYKVENKEVGSYLAKDDEIEAHAFNIAGSVLDIFGTKDKGLQFLKNPKTGVLTDHHFDMYLNTFGKDHMIIKRLMKKIVMFMDKRHASV